MKNILLVVLLLLIIGGGAYYFYQQQNSSPKPVVENTATTTVETKTTLEPLTVPVRFDNVNLYTDEHVAAAGRALYHNVYPVTENEDINQLIAADAEEFKNEFMKVLPEVEAASTSTLHYRQHFEVPFANDNYIAFTIERSRSRDGVESVEHRPFVYNRQTGVVLSLEEIFTEPQYQEKILKIAKDQLTTLLGTSTDLSKLPLENIELTKDAIVVYLESAKKAGGEEKISVPYEALKGYIDPSINKAVESADETKTIPRAARTDSSTAVDCRVVPCVALTFDDGPSSYTADLLETLEKEGVKATFFIIGRNVQYQTAVLDKMAAGGHVVGNHTWDHPDLKYLTPVEIESQLSRTDAAVSAITGENTKSLRPPYGSFDSTVQAVAGLPLILWNVDPEDWSTRDTASNISRMTGASAGSIILSHDIYKETVDAIPAVIADYKKRGFSFVTVEELYAPVPLEEGEAYYGQ